MKLYALLVGINEYDPNSSPRVSSLDACLNDIAQVKAFLTRYFGQYIAQEDQILTLTNAAATRQNVIAGFEKHLTQASASDIALVYYSGHGSYGVTAKEFQPFTTDSQEQTWVLHDSRVPGNFDLADKEIALLLERVAQKSPHILVIADSCHSGSITRDVGDFMALKPRFTSGRGEARPLETYLDNAFAARGSLDVPLSPHVLFSACDRTERAWEGTEGHGVFTKAILSVLEKSAGQISYADLFVRARASILTKVKNQTPQLEVLGGFSANQGFLGQNVSGVASRRYPIRKRDNRWRIDVGAGNGLATDFDKPIVVRIYDAFSDGEKLGESTLMSVNVTESEVYPTAFLNDVNREYWGEMENLPLSPVFVHCADAAAKEKVAPLFEKAHEGGIFLHDEAAACRFEISLENGGLVLKDREANVVICRTEGTEGSVLDALLEQLNHVARWHRTLELTNNKSKMRPQDLDFNLVLYPDGDRKVCTDPVVTLEYDGTNIPFCFEFSNRTGRALHTLLLHQSSLYGITKLHGDSQPVPNGTNNLALFREVFSMSDGSNLDTDTLKFIVSSEPIDASVFEQANLELGETLRSGRLKAIGASRGIGATQPDWQTKTITVRLVRRNPDAVGIQTIALGEGIRIEGGAALTGTMNWAALVPKTRSVVELPLSNAFFVDNPNFSIVNVAGKSRGEDQSILELSNLNVTGDLNQNPLKIVVPAPQKAEDDLILPLVFDGEYFMPVGKTAVNAAGELEFSLTHIPEEQGPVKTRSLGGALRMFFVKFAHKWGFGGETHTLQWVDYANDGAVRRKEGVSFQVQQAKRVLVLIHGIIGDTEDMCKPFDAAVKSGKYDVVLTYDYENLNTTIEENAKILREKLEAVGFGENDEKELTLLAHSMGGLVSRHFIEKCGGAAFVNKLIMAGTPNGGSKFGQAPQYIDWLAKLCSMGATFFPGLVASIAGTAGRVLSFAKSNILISLEQMNVGSDFINELGKNPKPDNVVYVAVAGDLGQYTALYQAEIKQFMEKVAIQTGEWIYSGEANDIAVSVNSIQTVAAEKHVVPCHHMNYFVVKESMDTLSAVL